MDKRTYNLRGYYERMRRLLGVLGADDVPSNITGVVIVGDSREPGATNDSYRRFSSSRFGLAAIAVDTVFKWRFNADCVIESVYMCHTNVATGATTLAYTTAADVAADGAATWGQPTTQQASWIDRNDLSVPPISIASNGSTGLGSVFCNVPLQPSVLLKYDTPLFFPTGSGLYIRYPNNGVANYSMTISGYVFK